MDEPHTLERLRPGERPGEHPGELPDGTRPRRRHWLRRLLPWIILLLVAAVIAWALLRPHPKPANPSGRHGAAAANTTTPVAVATARIGAMPVVLTELGTVTSLATVTVQSQIAGYLLEVDFQEGQEVHRGQQLALIDPRPYEATLHQYQGQLARDTASLNQARIDLARYQGLLRQHSIAQQTVADQVYLVGQDQGTVESDKALVASAALNIDYCHIKAPVDGRVGLRQVDAGNYVTQNMTNGLVVLTMLHPISVIFSVPENEIGPINARLRAGAVLPVEAYDSTNTIKLASGHVSTLDNVVDTATGTVKLRAIFDNTDETLFPNQFVNARLLLNTIERAVLVPSSAVQTGPDGQFVYVVGANNTVAVTNVKVGTTSASQSVITTGLAAGQKVVTDGTEHLSNGAKVMVPSAAQAAGSAGPAQRRHRHAAQ